MSFNLDFNDVFEGVGLIPDGEYEIVINKCGENATKSGAEYTEFDLIIRNDVEQPCKNYHIFHKNWRAKETGRYNMKSFNTIGKACQLQEKKEYKTFQELLDDFVHRTARVYVKNEENAYGGKTTTNLNVKVWDKSKVVGPCKHEFKKDNASKTVSELMQSVDMPKDDELPF